VEWLSSFQSNTGIPSEAVLIGLVVALWVVLRVFRSARSKGFFGEFRVRSALLLRLDSDAYRSLHNLTLPVHDGTTQIDHLIVSRFGVFVIETKNLTGWIFGDERSRNWTQSVYGNNYQFLNPLRQNYKHLKAVENLLGFGSKCLHSVVVFVGSSRFQTAMPPNVLKRGELVPYIRSKTEVVLSDDQVDDAIQRLKASAISGFGARRQHMKSLRENESSPVCARCGKAMVLRTAKRGPSPGTEFWGCSGYPQCRFTRDID